MQGGYGEFVLIDARMAVRLPDGMDHDAGALVEPLASALRGIGRMALAPGARVAIVGGGAIGLGAAYWARRLGAGPIAIIACSRRSEGLAAEMGADGLITAVRSHGSGSGRRTGFGGGCGRRPRRVADGDRSGAA